MWLFPTPNGHTHLPDKVLGIYVDNTDCTNKNTEHKLRKLRNIIAKWKHRDLSLKGGALVINGLLTSTLWYHVANILIPALRINTIRRLLSHEQARWKFLTSYFLHPSHMPTGKHTLALDFHVQHVDPTIPQFHKDPLTAWLHHTKHHTRTNPPATLADIVHQPLFKNPLITVNDNPLYY